MSIRSDAHVCMHMLHESCVVNKVGGGKREYTELGHLRAMAPEHLLLTHMNQNLQHI